MSTKDNKANDRRELSKEQYNICFLKGTEEPFSGKYDHFYEQGTYSCISCERPLFVSETKFNSGSGWPSFFQPIDDSAIAYADDNSLGRHRIEVMCKNCDAHLGHVFEDGPPPTGKRYCINSLALEFHPKKS